MTRSNADGVFVRTTKVLKEHGAIVNVDCATKVFEGNDRFSSTESAEFDDICDRI